MAEHTDEHPHGPPTLAAVTGTAKPADEHENGTAGSMPSTSARLEKSPDSGSDINLDEVGDSDASELQTKSAASDAVVTVVIHGKKYDISNFDDHPGGPAWLKCVAGEDATTHFEAHHLRIDRARARLATLPVIGSARIFHKWDWSETGFHATVRRRAAAALLENVGVELLNESDAAKVPREIWRHATSSTLAMRLTRIFAVAVYIAAFAATCVTRSPWMAIVCGVMTAVMGGFGHNALHQRGESWDCWLFECGGMSHDEYRMGAHTEHHMNPNLPEDPDAFGMSPFVVWAPPADGRSVWRMLRCIFSPLVFHIVAAVAILFSQGSHLSCPGFCKRDARRNCGLVAPLLQLCMLILSGWLHSLHEDFLGGGLINKDANGSLWILHSIGLWFLIWTSGSFYFMLVTNVTHNQERNWMASPFDVRDWGAWQMATATDISIPCGLRGVPLCGMMLIFLHEQTLHHLCPAIDHSRLPCIRPIVQRTAKEFGLTLHPPRNYFSIYIGMLAALAGISVSNVWASTCSSQKQRAPSSLA
mmetsp:Transcript_4217/g.7985  ORF Transcript_4217/g.7985 Transcript_4217/m.7985 type:complete len:532 (+) Transcript_4217:57-1652(+)